MRDGTVLLVGIPKVGDCAGGGGEPRGELFKRYQHQGILERVANGMKVLSAEGTI
jgi:hypothetical protein